MFEHDEITGKGIGGSAVAVDENPADSAQAAADIKTITVDEDGTICFIWDDGLADMCDLGEPNVSRASHVEPNNKGEWEADLSPVDGPTLGPFKYRREALAAEVAWLEENGF